jgi:hypothetical protein
MSDEPRPAEGQAQSEPIEYGVLPPLGTVVSNGLRGTYVKPGCSLEEWERHKDEALRKLMATYTPEELAEVERYLAELKRKRR